jgi:outer membrane protein assembly factor BamB
VSIIAGGVPGTTNWIWGPVGAIDYSTAALGTNGDLYIGSKDNCLWSFNAKGATNRSWRTQGIVQGSPALGADGTIYCGSGDGNFYAFNPDGATQRVWSVPVASSALLASPTLGADDYGCYYAPGGNWYFMKSTEGFGTELFGYGGTVPIGGLPL